MSKETFHFQAEITKLLDLFAKSLYTHKEIFLRELVSNSSDALSKIKFELLQSKEIQNPELNLEINIKIDKDNKKIVISDTGIGMTKDELISNLGTIARSGTLEYLKKLSETNNQSDKGLIGQFGVGFYSVFMVAKEVIVETKSYIPQEKPYKWIADGSGDYTIEDSDKTERGTAVTLILKDDEAEYLEKDRIEDIIQKYSNFVPFPVKINDEQSNKISALWTQPKSSVTEEQYKEFYKFVSNSFDDPMYTFHLTADVPIQFSTILFIPTTNTNKFFGYMNKEYGPSLYCNKVLIVDKCKDLLPAYFDFVKGVVDTEDIPLNISRETLQDNRNIVKLNKVLTKKILGFLEEKATEDPEKYNKFWNEFGNTIKQGLSFEFENRDKLADLLRFNSSYLSDEKGLISLKDYVSRMGEEQKEIYYINGENRYIIEKNPHLEIFKKNGIEVLYLYDPADDFVLSGLGKYGDKEIKSIDQANLDSLKKEETIQKSEDELDKLNKLTEYIKELLKDKVTEVRKSNRLTDSPVCLVNPDNTTSTQMQKIMKMFNENFEIPKKIFEINYDSILIKSLAELQTRETNKDYLDNCILQLFDNALMLDGIMNQPSTMIPRINKLMEDGVKNIIG